MIIDVKHRIVRHPPTIIDLQRPPRSVPAPPADRLLLRYRAYAAPRRVYLFYVFLHMSLKALNVGVAPPCVVSANASSPSSSNRKLSCDMLLASDLRALFRSLSIYGLSLSGDFPFSFSPLLSIRLYTQDIP